MSGIAFDTLKYAQRMKAVGFTEEQANEQATAIAEVIDDKLATKQDLKELELRLVIRLGSMMFAAVVIVAALVKLL